MQAVDTNVLARFVLRDDAAQVRRADALLKTSVWVPVTVFLELAWVLGCVRASEQDVVDDLRALLGLPNLHCEQGEAVALGLSWAEQGMDVADALHLALSQRKEGFRSFDKALIAKAKKAKPRTLALVAAP